MVHNVEIPGKNLSASLPRGSQLPRGLYFQSAAGFRALDSVALFPDVAARSKTNWRVLGSWDHAREERRYVLPGSHARALVAGPRPTLYLRSQRAERGWSVVRLIPQTDHRELGAAIADVFAREPRLTFASGAPVRVDPSATADDVVALRPTADLPPGEYLIFRFVSDQPWLIEGYAFEVSTR